MPPPAKKTPAKKSEKKPRNDVDSNTDSDTDSDTTARTENDGRTKSAPTLSEKEASSFRQPDFLRQEPAADKEYTVEVPSYQSVNGVTKYMVRTLLDGKEHATVHKTLGDFIELHANLGLKEPFPCTRYHWEMEFFHTKELRDSRRVALDAFMKEQIGAGSSHDNLKSVIKFFLQSAVSDTKVHIEVPKNEEADELFEKLKKSSGFCAMIATIGEQGELIEAQAKEIDVLKIKVESLEAAQDEVRDEIGELRRWIEELRGWLMRLQEEVEGYERLVKLLRALEEKLTSKIDELEQTFDSFKTADAKHEALQNEKLAHHKVRLDKHMKSIKELKEKVSDNQNALAAQKEEEEKDEEARKDAEEAEAQRLADIATKQAEKERLVRIARAKEAKETQRLKEEEERHEEEIRKEKLRVAKEEERKQKEKAERLRDKKEKERHAGKLDINTCLIGDLKKLPYVNDYRAELIIENRPYRKQGTFYSDLMKIDDIGDATATKVVSHFYIGKRS